MTATFPGYTKPTAMSIDGGALLINTTPLGATRDGFTFDPGVEYRNPPWDGKHADIAEQDRIIKWKPVLKGKMIEATAAAWLKYEPGSTSDGSAGNNRLTPHKAGQLLEAGAYLTDVYCAFRQQGSGTYMRIHFPTAFIVKYLPASKPDNEMEIDIEIEARLGSAVTDFETCPYDIQFLS